GLRHRPGPQAVRHRRRGRRAAGSLRRRLRRAVPGADACRCGDPPSGAALDEFRDRQSGAPSFLHRAGPRREIQSQEPDRRGDLSRLRRIVWLGVRQLTGAGTEAWRDRARRIADRGGLARSVGCFGTYSGTPRCADGRGRGARSTSMTIRMTRREFAIATGAAVLVPPAFAQTNALLTRAIPSSGERLPAVGLGTAQVFNSNDEVTRQKAAGVVQALIAGGGRLIDTSSVYGDAEAVLGDVTAPSGLRSKLFIATKLESPNAAELKRSLSRLKTEKLDLLQFHNVDDPQQSLAQFKEWKAQGVCRYIGITSTRHQQYAAIEAVLGREKPDFVQIDYSIDDREAEKRILPLAAEVKAGVLTALPFGRARLFRAVNGKDIPDWARGFAESWAQFFLKYLLGDPRVTAVIPGTADPAHMTDNIGAMRGPLPDSDQRRQMVAFIEAL